jgi:hypothetical protein
MGFAEDVSALLSTQGFTAASIFCGDLPERPHQALCVTPTAGLGSLHAFGSLAGAGPAERVRCQLRARATDYQTAETIISSAHSILDGMRARATGGRLYQWARAASTPYYIGTDDEGRPLFACNYELTRSLTT